MTPNERKVIRDLIDALTWALPQVKYKAPEGAGFVPLDLSAWQEQHRVGGEALDAAKQLLAGVKHPRAS